jgi:hypothetical protein
MAEPAGFAVDTPVIPAGVLSGEAEDQDSQPISRQLNTDRTAG